MKQIAIKRLESTSGQTDQTFSPKLFFPLLHEFAKFLLLSSQFKQELKIIIEKGEKANKPAKIRKKEALQESLRHFLLR